MFVKVVLLSLTHSTRHMHAHCSLLKPVFLEICFVFCLFHLSSVLFLLRASAFPLYAEIKVHLCREPRAMKYFLSLKPGVGQNIGLHASPAARTSAFLISEVMFISLHLSKYSLLSKYSSDINRRES